MKRRSARALARVGPRKPHVRRGVARRSSGRTGTTQERYIARITRGARDAFFARDTVQLEIDLGHIDLPVAIARVDPRHDPAAPKTITEVADQIEASAKDLLYRVTKPETGVIKAMVEVE